MELSYAKPHEVRLLARNGRLRDETGGVCLGYAQANLVVLPQALAFDFLLFCFRNPQPCPLLEVTDVGSFEPTSLAPGADLRNDIARYRIYRYGELHQEVDSIAQYWREDFVGFLLGCSVTFEEALLNKRIPVRHLEEGRGVTPMYKTSIACRSAGAFHGPMVVSMRPIPHARVSETVTTTARFPKVHGAPVHIGDPKAIGIDDLSRTDYGAPVRVGDGETPVFWACGVTPQAVALVSKPELMITHAPGHMFITDVLNEQLASF